MLRVALLAGSIIAGPMLASPALSATVFINDPALTITSIGTIVVGAKYRFSQTNFDQSLDAGGGTTNVPGGQNFIATNRGNRPALNNQLYSFVFEHRTGDGFIFSMTSPAGATWTQAWGTFAPAIVPAPDQAVAQLRSSGADGGTPGVLRDPNLPYNALHLEWRATPLAGPNNPTVFYDSLSFSAPGLTQIGLLDPTQTVLPGANPANPNFPDPNADYYSQWLVSDMNLALFDWTLAGRVSLALATPGVAGGDELVRFDVSGKQVEFVRDVPAPAGLALFGLGALALAGARRR